MTSGQTAILSVSDKTGLLDLASALAKCGVRLVASGGTARSIRDANLAVSDVSDITGFPEILDGRVKTLHPAVHGGILARDIPSDEQQLAELKISKVDYVVCNLYPFKHTVSKSDTNVTEALDNLDIGGVALLRAAGKAHPRVSVLSDPKDYRGFIEELVKGSGISRETRQHLALKAFEHTADYDTAISDYLRNTYAGEGVQQISLRYGLNPHQKASTAFMRQERLPFKIICGAPGYINMLDALNAWQLVKDLRIALKTPAAASFKHVSPAGAAIGVPLSEVERKVYMVNDIEGLEGSALAQAYARARGADRQASFGDFIALSDNCDVPTAKIISREVSDGVIAPGYSEAAKEILSKKKGGKYLMIEIDPSYEPPNLETRTVYGIQLSQERNDATIVPSQTFNKALTLRSEEGLAESAVRDLTVATIALKYTQSNSVCYALNGQVIGLGAGQQSRIACTRLAGDKADNWWMRFHERALHLKFKKIKRPEKVNAIDALCKSEVPDSGIERDEFNSNFEEVPQLFTAEERQQWLNQLDNVAVSSDAFVGLNLRRSMADADIAEFPFSDNIYRLAKSGAKFVAAPMGSQNDHAVLEAAEKLGITFVDTAIRLFHH